MKISASTSSGVTFQLDVSEELELENFKAFCEAESGIPSDQIVVSLNGRSLSDDKRSLKELGVKDGDLVLLYSSTAVPAPSARPPNRKRTLQCKQDVCSSQFQSLILHFRPLV